MTSHIIGGHIKPSMNPFGISSVAVSKDPTSGIACPASAAEWASVMSSAGISSGGPSYLWLLQEASGNPADSIDSATLSASGVITYQTAVSGWSRKAISAADGSSGRLTNTATVPNTQTTSYLLLTYRYVSSSPGATRQCLTIGSTLQDALSALSTGHYETIATTTAVGTASPFDGSVRPVVLKHDVTHSADVGYTNQEKMVPTFKSLSGAGAFLMGNGSTPAGGVLYGCLFTGAAAELSDAQVKTLLQALGWTIPWT